VAESRLQCGDRQKAGGVSERPRDGQTRRALSECITNITFGYDVWFVAHSLFFARRYCRDLAAVIANERGHQMQWDWKRHVAFLSAPPAARCSGELHFISTTSERLVSDFRAPGGLTVVGRRAASGEWPIIIADHMAWRLSR
jgi:hypothetical protein